MKRSTIALVIFFLLSSAACVAKPTVLPSGTQQESSKGPIIEVAQEPAITGISVEASFVQVSSLPTPPATTERPSQTSQPGPDIVSQVVVGVEVANFVIVDRLGNSNSAGQGHLIYYLDPQAMTSTDGSVAASGKNVVQRATMSNIWYDVGEGIHTFSVQLVNNDGSPLVPAVVASVTGALVHNTVPNGQSVFGSISAKVGAESQESGSLAGTRQSFDVVVSTGPWGRSIADSPMPPVSNPEDSSSQIVYYLDKLPPRAVSPAATSASGTSVQVPATVYSYHAVQPGQHVFAAELVNADSSSMDPPQVVTVKLDVESSAAALSFPGSFISSSPVSGSVLPRIKISPSGEWRAFLPNLGPAVEGDIGGNRYLFVAANRAGDNRASGLLILDIRNPDNPTKVAYLGSAEGDQIWGVNIFGSVLFASCTDYLWVIDVSQPSSPKELSRLSDIKARGSAVSGHYLFVNDNGERITTADISTPSAPRITGSFPFPAGDPIQVIKVSGSMLFVLRYTPNQIASVPNGLYILDVSSPSALKQISYFPNPGKPGVGYVPVPTGSPPQTFTVASIYSDIAVRGNYAFMAAGGPDGMQVLDISNPAVPRKVANTPGIGADRILLADDLAYLAWGDVGEIMDVFSPENPLGIGDFNFESTFGLGLFDNRVYFFVDANGPSIEIVNNSGLPTKFLPTPTKTTLTSSANPSVPGQTLTFYARVSPIPDGGTVQFTDNGTNIGDPATLDTSGNVGYITSFRIAGEHTISVRFSGDSRYAPSSGSLVQTVNGRGVTFPDPNLEDAIRQALNKPSGSLYQSELLGITRLSAAGRGIVDLSGIQYCANLGSLDLAGNQISDLSPLSKLVNLNSLLIAGNQISDISPVAGLINLDYLGIYSNQIKDLSVLSGLKNLETLVAADNQISDISVLARLTNLGNVDLQDNLLTDISAFTRNPGFHRYGYIYVAHNDRNTNPGSRFMSDVQTLLGRDIYVVYQ